MTNHSSGRDPGMDAARKKTKFKLKLAIAAIAAIAIAAIAFMMWPASISRAEAQEIALTHVSGGLANRAERDFEQFQRVWSVEVFSGGLVHEVYVSMRTGEVVRVEVGGWD